MIRFAFRSIGVLLFSFLATVPALAQTRPQPVNPSPPPNLPQLVLQELVVMPSGGPLGVDQVLVTRPPIDPPVIPVDPQTPGKRAKNGSKMGGGNQDPVAVPDVFTTLEGEPLVVSVPGHLANDFDPDGDPVEWVSYTFPAGGTMTATESEGSFVYTPNPGFSGLDEMSYTITDGNGGVASSRLLILVVDDQNRAPVAVADVFTTPQNNALTVTAPGMLGNDFDLDGDTLEWISYTFPSGGTVTATESEGSFVYTPNPGFSGLDEITYTITDGNGGIASSTLLILVVDDQNRAPVAVADVFTTPQNTALTVIAPGMLGNDFDLDGDALEWISYTFAANGVISGTDSNGSFVYTPNAGFSGLDEVTYTITDGNGGIASASLFIKVLPAPGGTDPVAVPDVFTTDEGVGLTVTAPGLLGNDSDPNGDMLEWISYTIPSHGSITGAMADGAFVYTPDPGFSGVEDISYTITDGNGGIASSRLIIKVLDDQNRPPVAVADVFTTPEGVALNIAAPGHLGNDFDLDGDALEWISYTFPAGGTVTGTMSDGSFVYTPDPGFSGLDDITYTITDGNGGIASSRLVIQVLDDQNSAPVAVPDVFTTPIDTPLVVSAPGQMDNDFDIDGDPLEWISYAFPSSGTVTGTLSDGSFVYTPNPGFSGIDDITYTISDGNGGIDSSRMLIYVGPTAGPAGPPGGPNQPVLVPVFGPAGLVLLMLAVGLIGVRAGRR